MPAKKTPMNHTTETPVEELSYEDAFAALEEIVNLLENESHSLDKAMAYFRRLVAARLALSQREAESLD